MTASLVALLIRYKLPIILASVGVIFIVLGIFSALAPKPASIEILESTSSPSLSPVIAEIAGAVEQPGVYTLARDARLEQLIALAGGLSAEADREFVDRSLNRAARVSDGAKVYIPKKGESKVAGVVASSEKININTATLSQLVDLPGVGEVTAQKIISGRPYQRIEELTEGKIVTQAVWEKIKDKIKAY